MFRWLALIHVGFVAALSWNPCSVAHAQAPHAYSIRAELDTKRRRVIGTERIAWTNTSTKPVQELYFHLYLNAFENERTVFMTESRGALRGVRAQGRGHIDVTSMRLHDDAGVHGIDLLAAADTELVRGDRTQMRVRLPKAARPGERLTIDVAFEAHLPPLFARSGHAGDFFMVAQWFPKLARLEPNGSWATFPYHAHGEFYADFADYDVEITTPARFVVGSTGELVSETLMGESVRRKAFARRVHDFAFAAWPHFEERRTRASGVHVRVLAPPGYGCAVDRHIEVTRAGLRRFGNLFGAYPYTTLTIIVPPRGASGAAGMEYPMLFVTAGPWITTPGVHVGVHDDVTAHELAHQWFQGLVATNEVAWPMLDEGLATWATLDLLRAMHGTTRSAVGVPGLSIDAFALTRTLVFGGERSLIPPGRPAYAFRSDTDYGRSVYGYTALVLERIGHKWGHRKLQRALGRYTRANRFAHPTPEDLFDAFDATYGPGFSKRFVAPALLSARSDDLQVDAIDPAAEMRRRDVAARNTRPEPRRWPSGLFAWLLHAFQSVVGVTGP